MNQYNFFIIQGFHGMLANNGSVTIIKNSGTDGAFADRKSPYRDYPHGAF